MVSGTREMLKAGYFVEKTKNLRSTKDVTFTAQTKGRMLTVTALITLTTFSSSRTSTSPSNPPTSSPIPGPQSISWCQQWTKPLGSCGALHHCEVFWLRSQDSKITWTHQTPLGLNSHLHYKTRTLYFNGFPLL